MAKHGTGDLQLFLLYRSEWADDANTHIDSVAGIYRTRSEAENAAAEFHTSIVTRQASLDHTPDTGDERGLITEPNYLDRHESGFTIEEWWA